MRVKKSSTVISGHRNPDIDSIAAACALAELRRKLGMKDVIPICPGAMPERARFLFEKFAVKPPVICTDLYPKIKDIMDPAPPVIVEGTPLLDAICTLSESHLSRLPVTTNDNRLLGMLSPLSLLSNLLQIGDKSDNTSFTGRRVFSSPELIVKVLAAEAVNLHNKSKRQNFDVFVAAMNLDSFFDHLPAGKPDKTAIIVGDRPDIHLMALNMGVRLLIITGDRPVDPTILKEARSRKVCIIQTRFDSATVIRRLKFSVPVEKSASLMSTAPLAPQTRLRDVRKAIFASAEDVFPVQSTAGKLAGVVCKSDFDTGKPYRLIMVDHNELEQSLPGAEETPIVEVVDHHRLGMPATTLPIKITCDIVGSTCTLISEMYRQNGERPTKEIAGLLLGGVISDTLLLRSPTSTKRDGAALAWLEKIAGMKGEELMHEMMNIGSLLTSCTPEEIVNADRKDYSESGMQFALAQVEETNFEQLHTRLDELLEEIDRVAKAEKLAFFGLLVTDVVRENSELLASGDAEVMSSLPYKPAGRNLFSLPGVLSRKKQLLPQMLGVLSDLGQ
ncbi:putative manganese-dependent inorganic diphosphatase [Lentisphaerota bacterium ZTH]|nr:putative manganese-dependent inorganic diphosphatase [Lentisphaerota bacterium]WET06560.1 putative manganese-dependent inorganic diphosphatase [Lentisphaerota bacterium ZTH]